MGCDIHCYIEYKPKEQEDWLGFGGRINPGRCYEMFNLLAGVRGPKDGALVAPRGMPEDAAYTSNDDNRYYISETKCDEFVTPEIAKGWVDKGWAKYDGDGNHWVTNPDWHSHSWLTTSEYEMVVHAYRGKINDCYWDYEYEVVLAAMKQFESMGCNARLVFWFDN